MFDHLLPRAIDNTYRGHKLALWFLGLLVLLKGVIGVNSIVNGYTVMTSADGIPLDTFPPAATQSLVALWALLGLGHLVIAVLGLLVLVRYRGMTAFLFALLLLQNLSARVIQSYLPLVTVGKQPGYIVNAVSISAMILGLVLSLWKKGAHHDVTARGEDPAPRDGR